jgi:hypothetical protein
VTFLDAADRFLVAGFVGFEKVLGLVLELIEIRTGRQLPFHDELPFVLRLVSASAGRKKVRKQQGIVLMSGLSPSRGPVASQTHKGRIVSREEKAIAKKHWRADG